jgi:heme/copper-type cytochrome/quinol oxidase subunit 3
MDMNIPYIVEARPDTGLTNGKLGIWLFLASEVMLFGALFSTYIILRIGSETWPHGALNVPLGAVNTVLLISSSVTMVLSWAAFKMHEEARGKKYLLATVALAALFLINKFFEYREHLGHGAPPSASTFDAIYFTLTGLHGLHIVGGIAVMLYLLGPGASLWRKTPEQYTNRIEYTGLYWHFVDLVWIFLFPVLYLL